MTYGRSNAKSHARANMKGIWAAALTPFKPDLSIDEDGFRRNIEHWIEDLKIDGLFIAGKQGEFFAMSIEERKRVFDIALALWSHPDSGYLLSPQLCNRLADIETVVAIKYSVPRPMYVELTQLAGDRIIVSTASESEWLDNILELGWQLYLCSSPPYLYQTKHDRRMRDYTDLAFAGDAENARLVRNSLDPVRKAFRGSRPAEKPPAHSKYWQELLGQAGGPVRAPMLPLTEAEKAATRAAFEACGLQTTSFAKAS